MLKKAARHLKKPGIISLGGGLPCPEYFPFESITMKVPVSPHFSEAATHSSGKEIRIGKYDVTSSSSQAAAENPPVYDLSIALNYGQAHGSAQMMRFVTEHTELVSNPPYADWQSCLTVGSTAALEQALRMLCDKTRGDAVLTEEYSFSTALETAIPLGVKVFGVKMDEEGLLPGSMDEILSNWDSAARGGARKPHVLYTVPSGQNPTGATQGEQRRREIYAVCQKHDVYIIEDEPYYFLQMPPHKTTAITTGEESIDQFLTSLVPTLLSMDTDGRVMRMDSFSKVVVPGSRLGWITASAQMVERYIRHAEVCNQGPSGFSQVILHKLLDEEWGHEGYLRWLMNLRGEYTKRRDVMLDACEKFLPAGVVSWSETRSGMFVSVFFFFFFFVPPVFLRTCFRFDAMSMLDVTYSHSLLPISTPPTHSTTKLTPTTALDQSKISPPPRSIDQVPPANRRRNLQPLHRQGRPGRPRLVVPRRAKLPSSSSNARHVLPHHLCGRHAGEHGRGDPSVWRGCEGELSALVSGWVWRGGELSFSWKGVVSSHWIMIRIRSRSVDLFILPPRLRCYSVYVSLSSKVGIRTPDFHHKLGYPYKTPHTAIDSGKLGIPSALPSINP